jgi:hypothetical protein
LKLCHRCGGAWVSERRIPARAETCESCGWDLHCCLNCKFHAPGKPGDCFSPTIEPVLDKEKSNFCDEFVFADDKGSKDNNKAEEKSRNTWDSLFDGD